MVWTKLLRKLLWMSYWSSKIRCLGYCVTFSLLYVRNLPTLLCPHFFCHFYVIGLNQIGPRPSLNIHCTSEPDAYLCYFWKLFVITRWKLCSPSTIQLNFFFIDLYLHQTSHHSDTCLIVWTSTKQYFVFRTQESKERTQTELSNPSFHPSRCNEN